MDNNQLGMRIRIIRKKIKLTQAEMATALGLTNVSLSGYELGDNWPKVPTLIQISIMGNVSLDWLITGHETTLNEDEQEMINSLRRLDSQRQRRIIDLVADYAELLQITTK